MHTFTETQAAHALEVVINLMKNRRYFLYQHDPRSSATDPNYELDPNVFGPALELNRKIREAYATARVRAEESIVKAELELGFAKPDLSGNKRLVDCNRYSGGLDICRVYPLTAFLPHVPKSLEELTEQCFQQALAVDRVTEDDTAPKKLRQYRDDARKTGVNIWSQLHAMDARNPDNPLCVVVMQTRFDCGGSDANRDFMQSRVRAMQEFPHAMGYLFYQYSMCTRIVRHNHVVFNTSRDSHVNVHHWIDEKPVIYYNYDGGYTCSVIFVTVL